MCLNSHLRLIIHYYCTKSSYLNFVDRIVRIDRFLNYSILSSPLNPSPYQGEGNRERFVTLIVYDVLGNEISTLVNEEKPAGSYEVDFDGTGFSRGIYFYRLKAGDYSETKKMVLIK
ncbi:MAG: T9SS type A sorting domain-containing protein [Ignavibacterium sp.]|nr:MAG: T9SS type A sorting domain-containing protein [Ignavibacterium sp.]